MSIIDLIESFLLICIASACLLNYSHAEDYREGWKNTLVCIAAGAVLAIQGEMLFFLVAVLWQQSSMTRESWKRWREIK